SGQLLGLLLSDTGREITFAEIPTGHYFGELSALDGLPRAITISAVTTARLGVMSAPQFRLWMAREPRIALNVARELAHRNRLMTERIFGLVVHNVDQRVRVLLSRLAQANGQLRRGGVLYPAPTHDALASYVGANREAVSRVLARLSAEGIIGTGRRRITFLDIEALLAGL
ncbi:Crp/Fnr family transcriptional regulator, partial [Thioclava sp. BHET1]